MIPKTYFSAPLSKSAKDTEGRIRNIFEGQRRRPAVIVLALVAAVALLCGSVFAVRAKRTVPTIEDRWEQEKKEASAYAAAADGSAELPRFEYLGDDPYLAAVCEWIVRGGEQARYWESEVTIPCPLIAEIDDSDPQDVRVWGNFWEFSYATRGTTLFCVSGGESPGLLHLRAADSGYEVFNEEMVGDGEAYAKDMRRIFGSIRMIKLDALDREEVRTQYIADYVLQNDLPFTQYQDYGWDPVHIPGTPETPESAQIIHLVSPMGWSIDYDLREFSHDIAYGELESLTGVGKLQGISMDFERYRDTDAESVLAELERQMERPRREETFIGADSIPVTLVRDAALRNEVLKGSYVLALNETDTLAVSVSNTYYAVQGDPVVPSADAALAKALATFRLTNDDWDGELLATFPLLDAELVSAGDERYAGTTETILASEVGERIVDETMPDGTHVVLLRLASILREQEADVRYWAIDRGDTLDCFAREESPYPDEQYGVRSFTNVLGRDGFQIYGPRGAAYNFRDYYYIDGNGMPMLLDAAANTLWELDENGDGTKDVLWTYHGWELYYDFLDANGAVRRLQLVGGSDEWKGWSVSGLATQIPSIKTLLVYLRNTDGRTREGRLVIYPERVELWAS